MMDGSALVEVPIFRLDERSDIDHENVKHAGEAL
jgi:hypothetical protein